MKNIVGKNVRKYRLLANISQEQLANDMGYKHRSSISKIEKGEREMNQTEIQKICSILNVSPLDILGRSDKLNEYEYEYIEYKEYLPYLAQASDETIRNIRYMLGMPELKKSSLSGQEKVV